MEKMINRDNASMTKPTAGTAHNTISKTPLHADFVEEVPCGGLSVKL